MGIWWHHDIGISENLKFDYLTNKISKWNKKHFSLFHKSSLLNIQNKLVKMLQAQPLSPKFQDWKMILWSIEKLKNYNKLFFAYCHKNPKIRIHLKVLTIWLFNYFEIFSIICLIWIFPNCYSKGLKFSSIYKNFI